MAMMTHIDDDDGGGGGGDYDAHHHHHPAESAGRRLQIVRVLGGLGPPRPTNLGLTF